MGLKEGEYYESVVEIEGLKSDQDGIERLLLSVYLSQFCILLKSDQDGIESWNWWKWWCSFFGVEIRPRWD